MRNRQEPISSQRPSRRYLNVRQLAEYIDSTEGSVRQLVHHRRVPFFRVAGGRRVLFDIHRIDAWCAEQQVEVLEERENDI